MQIDPEEYLEEFDGDELMDLLCIAEGDEYFDENHAIPRLIEMYSAELLRRGFNLFPKH